MQRNIQATSHHDQSLTTGGKAVAVIAASAAALVAMAAFNRTKASQAEREHPPKGSFITIDGVRLHYVEAGSGEPLVLLHGNGSATDELIASGLVDLASRRFRVIAFDRPGFGYSERPRDRAWTAARQAALIDKAMRRLHAHPAVVFGHSWGTLVALNLALDHPESVRALTLASGYYFPTARADAVLLSPPALPVIGGVLANTLSPVMARMMWERAVRRMFRPARVEPKFRAYSKEFALRPGQLQAAAEESALMIHEANSLSSRYGAIRQPVVLVAGGGDRIVDTRRQSERLSRHLRNGSFEVLDGVGHMVHETATPRVVSAIHRAAASAHS